jgi:DNA-binding response OmpR family regulator
VPGEGVVTDATTTSRKSSQLARVLVVHEPAHPLGDVCEELRKVAIVRESSAAHEAFEELAQRAYACVVCRVGRSIAAAEFHRRVRASSWRNTPLVFVIGREASTDDVDYLHREGANWVTEHATPAEVVALVDAVRTR